MMMFALLQVGADEHVVTVGHEEVDAQRDIDRIRRS